MAADAREATVAAVRAKGEFVGEYVHHHKDGTRLSVVGDTITLRDAAGQVSGFLTVNRDSTAERAVEQQLRESEARIRLIMDNMPAAISLSRSRPAIHVRQRGLRALAGPASQLRSSAAGSLM